MEASQEISLSIHETNKLRISLGLKPLDTTPTVDEASKNFEVLKKEREKEQSKRELLDRISKEKSLKQREKKEGKTLADDYDENAMEWVKKIKAKNIQQKKAESIENASYSSKDLKGIRVAHKIDDITEAGDTILVLKDHTIGDGNYFIILDDGKDELINPNLMDLDLTKKRLESIKGKQHTAYEENKKGILPQYDEDEEDYGFQLASGGKVDLVKMQKKQMQISESIKKATVSLDYDKTKEITDYATKEEVVFKKPKKKKKRIRNKEKDDEIFMDSKDLSYTNASIDISGANFADDDELTQALARTRQINRKTNVIDLKPPSSDEEDTSNFKGMIISDTTEFVENLDTTPVTFVTQHDRMIEDDDDEETANIAQPKNIETTEDTSMQDAELSNGSQLMEVDDPNVEQETKSNDIVEEIINEPLVSSGLAATLALLNQRGLIEKQDEDAKTAQMTQRERFKWLAEQRKREAVKEMQKREYQAQTVGVKSKKKDTWERVQEEREKERKRVEAAEEKYKNYVPDVQLIYKDESGRELNQKEAYKMISQRFHGKASGMKKQEKKLLKLKEELQRNQMSTTDTPLKSVEIFEDKLKANGTSYIALSKAKQLSLKAEQTKLIEEQVEKRLQEIKKEAETKKLQKSIEKHKATKPVQTIEKVSIPDITTGKVGNFAPVTIENSSQEKEPRQKIAFGLSVGKRKVDNLDALASKRKRLE